MTSAGSRGLPPVPELFVRWAWRESSCPVCDPLVESRRCRHRTLMYPKVPLIIQKLIKTRYETIGVLSQTTNLETEPLIRSLGAAFPDDPLARDRNFEFMLGGELLVAPVYELGARTRRVYLPKGRRWQNMNQPDNELIEGGQEIEVPAPLDTLPVFMGWPPLSADESKVNS
ncbi:MAG: glycoside hydrolase family 31 protein [Anaerolineae bacterium]